ncbi:unnamed protein product, partial [Allacma fusca]
IENFLTIINCDANESRFVAESTRSASACSPTKPKPKLHVLVSRFGV